MRPTRVKRLRNDDAADLVTDDIAVTFHQCHGLAPDRKEATISLSPEQPPLHDDSTPMCLWTLPALASISMMRKTLIVWEFGPCEPSLLGADAWLTTIMRDMVAANAFAGFDASATPDPFVVTHTEQPDLLQQLRAAELRGWVLCRQIDDSRSAWTLTMSGLAEVHVQVTLTKPKLALAYTASKRRWSDVQLSTWELMDVLDEAKFTVHVLPPRTKKTKLEPFGSNRERVWYVRQNADTISREYLFLLYRALSDDSIVVPHLLDADDYNRRVRVLLGLTDSAGPALALGDFENDMVGRKRKRHARSVLALQNNEADEDEDDNEDIIEDFMESTVRPLAIEDGQTRSRISSSSSSSSSSSKAAGILAAPSPANGSRQRRKPLTPPSYYLLGRAHSHDLASILTSQPKVSVANHMPVSRPKLADKVHSDHGRA